MELGDTPLVLLRLRFVLVQLKHALERRDDEEDQYHGVYDGFLGAEPPISTWAENEIRAGFNKGPAYRCQCPA
jgi:hypothetical protein